MTYLLQYLFYPNPPTAQYNSPKVILLLVLCVLLIAGAWVFKKWRIKHGDTMFKKLSKSWGAAANWFGFIALILLVARTEGISFIAMRILWVFWALAFVAYIGIQYKLYKMRYYKIAPKIKAKKDPRTKYLPNRKK